MNGTHQVLAYADDVNMDLNSEDRLVSFDVEAFFPSIPVEKLMKYLEK